jgi:hypothetical protein
MEMSAYSLKFIAERVPRSGFLPGKEEKVVAPLQTPPMTTISLAVCAIDR